MVRYIQNFLVYLQFGVQRIEAAHLRGNDTLELGAGTPPPQEAQAEHPRSNGQRKPTAMGHLVQIGCTTQITGGSQPESLSTTRKTAFPMGFFLSCMMYSMLLTARANLGAGSSLTLTCKSLALVARLSREEAFRSVARRHMRRS